MDLIQKANKLGYKHYTEFTVEELDNLSLENSNKQIEYKKKKKWLREEHHLIVIVAYQYEHDSTPYSYWIYKENNSLPLNQWINDLKTYEEALEKGLQEALKLI